jgi:hypothetical protein
LPGAVPVRVVLLVPLALALAASFLVLVLALPGWFSGGR